MRKIAVISPSSRLTAIIKDVSQQRPLPLVISQASQINAVDTARALIAEGAGVLISRGKTAGLLRASFPLPVVEVRHTFFDCYNAWQKARLLAEKVVFLATSEAYLQILNKSRPFLDNVEVCAINPFDTMEQTERKISALVSAGFKVAIGGLSLQEIVMAHGLHYVMSDADVDATTDAIDEALHLLKIEEERESKRIELQSRYTMIGAIFDSISEGIFSVDQHGIITNMNPMAREYLMPLTTGQQVSDKLLLSYLHQVFESGESLSGALMELGPTPLTVSITPVKLDARVVGAVTTLQKQNEIKNIEQKMRRQLARSHVAVKTFNDIIGSSHAIQQARQLAARYAAVDSTVMIEGETGSGKELFAQSIHNASRRASAPFVAINCAAFAPGVLESELFGYVRGAFTGAASEGKAGIFELAHTGTIFLDEISETSPEIQLKLLRTIQERKVVRIGDNKVTPVDIRIITASNKDLPTLIKAGRFREDFYYRICVLPLFLPPLRQRRQDIPELIAFLNRSQMPQPVTLTDNALAQLCRLPWPGNIRQLTNIIERLAVIAQGEVVNESLLALALQDSARHRFASEPDEMASAQDEQGELHQALRQARGNRKLAAQMLGISTTTLWRKIKKYHLDTSE